MNSRAAQTVGKLLMAGVLLALIIFAYTLYSDINARRTTGILDVRTSQPQAVITVSRADSEAAVVGSGAANVRLKPGSYLLAATYGGKHATKVVQITQSVITKVNLSLQASSVLPSNDTSFANTQSLLDNGLSLAQVTNLEHLFLAYEPNAKLVIIDSNSVATGSHDPNNGDIFSLTFTGSIDNQLYDAVLVYSGTDAVELTLTDPATGAQLYGGSAPSTPDS